MAVKDTTFDRVIYDILRDKRSIHFDPPGDAIPISADVCRAVAETKRGKRKKALLDAAEILDEFWPM